MPSWKIHNKWAVKVGIPREISNYVNRLIDFPDKCPEFIDFCKEELGFGVWPFINIPLAKMAGGHDSGRRRKIATYIQLSFLRQKGSEYVKCWYLHHALDFIKVVASIYSIE